MKPTQRFSTLDSFRGISAMLVVFYHFRIVDAFTELRFFRRDELLINFFLVLSGFVMAHVHGVKQAPGFKAFVVSRVFRLYPLHLTMLLAFIGFELLRWLAYRNGFYFNSTPFSGPAAPGEILPNLFLLQAWTPLTDTMSFNYPSWTISIEFYIYLLFGGLCLLSMRNRFLACGGISFVAFVLIFSATGPLVEKAMLGLSCFFAGNIVYLVYLFLRDRWIPGKWLMTLCECAMLYALYWVMMSDLAQRSPLSSLMFCVLVLIFAFEGGLVSAFLKARFFLWLGKLSFSIYMTHAALIFVMMSVFIVAQSVTGLELAPMIKGQRFVNTGSVAGNNLLVIIAAIGALCLAWVAHRFIESKGYELGKSIQREGRDQPERNQAAMPSPAALPLAKQAVRR